MNTIRKKYTSTISFIEKAFNDGEYKIELYNDSGQTYMCTLHKTIVDNDICFQIDSPELPTIAINDESNYGLDGVFSFFNETERFFIPEDSVSDFTHNISNVSGKLKAFEYGNVREQEAYHRAIIPVHKTNKIDPVEILKSSEFVNFDIDSFNMAKTLLCEFPFSNTGCSSFQVNDYIFHFYEVEAKNWQVIEAISPMTKVKFKKYLYIIRLSFALLSGSFYKNSVKIVSSNDLNFDDISSCEYWKEADSIITDYKIIDPAFFKQWLEGQQEDIKNPQDICFDTIHFGLLCEKALVESRLMRSMELLVSSLSVDDAIQKGALTSVALETMTELIKDKNKDSFSSIPEPSLWKRFLKSVRESLKSIQDEQNDDGSKVISEEGIKILNSRINDLNKPTNRVKLEKPFGILGIELTEEEKFSIGRRNDFLHGDCPDDKGWKIMTLVNSLRIYSLVSRLILRSIGYEGHFIDPSGRVLLNRQIISDISQTSDSIDYDAIQQFINKDFSDLSESTTDKYETVNSSLHKTCNFLNEFVGIVKILKDKNKT